MATGQIKNIFNKEEIPITDIFTPSDATKVNMTTSKAYRVGNRIYIEICGTGGITISASGNYTIGTIKSGYRPSIYQDCACLYNKATSGRIYAPASIYVATTGTVALVTGTNGQTHGNSSYPWTEGIFVTYELF